MLVREMFVQFAAFCGKCPMRFSAVLLAGGKSSRMGRDKSALIVDGVPLWQRQLAVLGNEARMSSEEWLLVLAVDMPAMTPDFLCCLTDAARKGAGVVPVTDRIQPLAALYPCASLEIAETQLRDGRLKMECFVDELAARSLVRRIDVPAAQWPLFTNWNTPGDVAGGLLAPN